MRIAIGGILHESNTFVARPTPLSDFQVQVGPEIEASWRGTHHELAGFLEGANAAGAELYATLTAGATPSGPVAGTAFEALAGDLIARLKAAPRLDGLLLALHGAMVVEGFPEADGELLRRVRAAVGSELPVVVTMDFHANVSAMAAEAATAVLVYRTNPHVDQRACGSQAAALLARLVRERRRPTVARRQPPMLWNIFHQNTAREPLRGLLAETARLEAMPSVLAAHVAIGYPYADVPSVGPCAVVVGDDEVAEREAERLADRLWDARAQLALDLPDAEAAVRRALESRQPPVVLVDMGDNIGGGSPGDGTVLLAQLLRQGATGAVVVLYDPEAVQTCVRAGAGGRVRLDVGGKTDERHGAPVPVDGAVRGLHDGRFVETAARHGGRRYWDQGPTAVLELAGENTLVLNSRRTPPFSLEQLRSLNVAPERARVLVVKAAVAFRAAYEPIAGEIIEVDTPGVTAVDPRRFDYRAARRPLWPLDETQRA
jgi:microcystin degradation protein MlrC